MRCDATAIAARCLMDEILWNDGFDAREMIEQEYLACFDMAVGIVDFYVDSESVAQERECPHAPLI